MEIKDIKSSNKLIAEFMGATAYKHGAYDSVNFPEKTEEGFKSYDLIYLQYNSSWDWLMPVVEKIEKLGMSTEIHYFAGTDRSSMGYFGTTFIGYTAALSSYDKTNNYDSKINAVYMACVKFIKWYNNNKTTK